MNSRTGRRFPRADRRARGGGPVQSDLLTGVLNLRDDEGRHKLQGAHVYVAVDDARDAGVIAASRHPSLVASGVSGTGKVRSGGRSAATRGIAADVAVSSTWSRPECSCAPG